MELANCFVKINKAVMFNLVEFNLFIFGINKTMGRIYLEMFYKLMINLKNKFLLINGVWLFVHKN